MSFKGVIPPVTTPFHADGSIDRDGFCVTLEHLVATGVHGIIVGGTTGEYYAQSRDERVGLLKLARSMVKGKMPLIAGVGAIRTEDCIEYALVAKDLKCDGILIGSPYYAVPTQLELANHALAIDKAANLPVMLYKTWRRRLCERRMLRGPHPGPGHAAYWISEEAVAAFSKCLGRDQASNGTRVNALCPSEVNTPTLRTGSVRPSYDPYTAVAEINSTVPLGRIAEPTHVVFFLCSDAARSVAGTAVELNDAKAHY